MTDPYQYKEELCQDPAFEEAYGELDRINADPALRALYDAEEKRLRDELSALHYAKKTGLEEGLEQGLKAGIEQGQEAAKIAMALNLLSLGVMPNIIAQSMGRDEDWVIALKESK